MDRQCKDCKWWAADVMVCVNDASDNLADFTMPEQTCEEWEPAAEEPKE